MEIESIELACFTAVEIINTRSPKRVLGVTLFGSLARAEQTPESDVDLLVFTSDISPSFRLACKRCFCASLKRAGIMREADILVLALPQLRASGGLHIVERMRALDAGLGRRLLYGDDYVPAFEPPGRRDVLNYISDQLDRILDAFTVGEYEEVAQFVLFAEVGRHFALTGNWISKRNLATTSLPEVAGKAWAYKFAGASASWTLRELSDYVDIMRVFLAPALISSGGRPATTTDRIVEGGTPQIQNGILPGS